MQKDLAHRDSSAGGCTEDDRAIVARPRAEDDVEGEPEACGEKYGPLQNAQGTRQIAEPELIDKGGVCQRRSSR
jgi:hypothetical protein